MEPEFTYQKFVRQKIASRKRTAVIAVPGAGKTRPIIESLIDLGLVVVGVRKQGDSEEDNEGQRIFPKGSILIICSGPAVATWVRQIPQWLPSLTHTNNTNTHVHVVRGTAHKRHQMWANALVEPGIYITNFSVFWRDQARISTVKWGASIADEYHKAMRSRKSATYKHYLRLTRNANIMLLATGSVISKDPTSMFTAFQLVAPRVFTSYWKFVETYCITAEGAFGTEIVGVKNIQALHNIMDQYFAYVPEDVIADQLPEGLRSAFDAEMDDEQEILYRGLTDEMIGILETEDENVMIIAQNVLTRLTRLRQLLCCPRALEPSLGMGGGFEAICDTLEEDPHVVIFVPFRDACTEIVKELRVRGYDAHEMMGGVDHAQQAKLVKHFREKPESIIVCTIAYAESFDLETCKTAFFLGYAHLEANRQAEGRIRRATSEHKLVQWRYVRHKGTIDEEIMANLSAQGVTVQKVLSRPLDLIRALKGT